MAPRPRRYPVTLRPRNAGRRRSVTLADVAGLSGVSEMTVSRVINSFPGVSELTRGRVQRAIDELGYVPNQLARGLVGGTARIIALVIADITHPWFTQIARTVESAARAQGYTVLFGSSEDDPGVERSYLERFGAFQVDGVILAPAGDAAAANIPLLSSAGIPFVLIDRSVRGLAADLVAGESTEATALLTDHLLDVHGFTDVAIISGPDKVSTARDRQHGFRESLLRHGKRARPSQVVSGPYTHDAGHRSALRMLSARRRPRAIVAANSAIAFGVLQAARELGLAVPEELALVTVDDVELTAAAPFLTCVDRPARAVAEEALRVLLNRIAGDVSRPRRIILPGELRIRRSCGCLPPEATGALPLRGQPTLTLPGAERPEQL
jgi:LacI family transcriptional regulator